MASYYRLYNGDTEIYSAGAANGISNIKLNGKPDGTSTLTFEVEPNNSLARLTNFYDYQNPVRLTGASSNYTMFVGVFSKTETQKDGTVKVTCEDVLMALDKMYIRFGDEFVEKFRRGITSLSVGSIMGTVKNKIIALSFYTSVSIAYSRSISSEMVEVGMTRRMTVLDAIRSYVAEPQGMIIVPYTATAATSSTSLTLCFTDGFAQRTTSTQYQYAPDTIESGKNLTSMKVTKANPPYNAVTAYGGKRRIPYTSSGSSYDTRWGRKLASAASIGATTVRIKADSSHYVSVDLTKGAYLMIQDSSGNDIFYEVAIDDDTSITSGVSAVGVPIRPPLQTQSALNKDVFIYPAEWFKRDTFLGWSEVEVSLDSYSDGWGYSTAPMFPIGNNTGMLNRNVSDIEMYETVRAMLYENDDILDYNQLVKSAYAALVEANKDTTIQIEVNGLDPVMLDGLTTFYPMRVGAKYKVIDSTQGINVEMAVCEAQIDVCSPERSTFVFGFARNSTATALRNQRKATQEVRSRIQAG